VRERIDYRFRVPSAVVFTLYSYLEYPFGVPTAGSLRAGSTLRTGGFRLALSGHVGSDNEKQEDGDLAVGNRDLGLV
jgi:hypothetical protein